MLPPSFKLGIDWGALGGGRSREVMGRVEMVVSVLGLGGFQLAGYTVGVVWLWWETRLTPAMLNEVETQNN